MKNKLILLIIFAITLCGCNLEKETGIDMEGDTRPRSFSMPNEEYCYNDNCIKFVKKDGMYIEFDEEFLLSLITNPDEDNVEYINSVIINSNNTYSNYIGMISYEETYNDYYNSFIVNNGDYIILVEPQVLRFIWDKEENIVRHGEYTFTIK